MQNCHNDESARFYKEVVVKSNQARDVEPSSIKELMEQNGVDGRMGIRIGIMPAEVGKESRFICCPPWEATKHAPFRPPSAERWT